MAFYKTQDINKEVTLFVKQYLDNGYWFDLEKMRTVYSNCLGNSIELTNGIEDVKIWLVETFENYYLDVREYELDCIVLQIKTSVHTESRWDENEWIAKVDYKMFYEIEKNKWTDEIKLCAEIKAKKIEKRWFGYKYKPYEYNNITHLKKYNAEKIIDIVRKRKGYKSCKKSEITDVVRINTNNGCFYHIYIEGKKKPVTVE